MTLRARIASYLVRRTSGRQLIPEIDGLRSIAILSVLLFHAHGNYTHKVGFPEGTAFTKFVGDIFRTGEFGVPLFFVISGFILALPFANYHLHPDETKKISLGKYFKRRLTRLEPPYVLMLCFALVMRAATSGHLKEWVPNFFASLFYVHNIVYDRSSVLNVVAWSLEVEVQFYLLAPLLACIFAIAQPWIRRAIFVAIILTFSIAFGVDKPILGLSLLNHLSYFATGMLFADFYLTDLQDSSAKSKWWDVVVLVALAGVFGVVYLEFAPRLVVPWLILIGYCGLFKANWSRRFFCWLPIVIFGGMCYSIYLWHVFLIATFQRVAARLMPVEPDFYVMLGFVAAASIFATLGSTVLFALVERPTMNPRWPSLLAAFVKRPFVRTHEKGDTARDPQADSTTT